MASIGYKKAHNTVPQSWIIDFLKLYNISDKVTKFIEKIKKNWRM